jgi:hypothetical protein
VTAQGADARHGSSLAAGPLARDQSAAGAVARRQEAWLTGPVAACANLTGE